MTVVVMDGQGGKMGSMLIERIKAGAIPCAVTAIGTNSIATSAMLKAGADAGATGENPAIVACRTADVIIGPIGILAADSLMGEVTPSMAVAVGQSGAKKLLLPVNLCNNIVVGTQSLPMAKLIGEAVQLLRTLCCHKPGPRRAGGSHNGAGFSQRALSLLTVTACRTQEIERTQKQDHEGLILSRREPFVAFFIGMGHCPGRNGFHRKEGTTR